MLQALKYNENAKRQNEKKKILPQDAQSEGGLNAYVRAAPKFLNRPCLLAVYGILPVPARSVLTLAFIIVQCNLGDRLIS